MRMVWRAALSQARPGHDQVKKNADREDAAHQNDDGGGGGAVGGVEGPPLGLREDRQRAGRGVALNRCGHDSSRGWVAGAFSSMIYGADAVPVKVRAAALRSAPARSGSAPRAGPSRTPRP